ncbi:hypothetical protein AB0C88_37810 [Streptomyces chartreusis]|uniref:hypothetical protein n=1 Tax=Streptomyces chartreusis TaxID=1969 RepID=UPI0033CA3D5A
MSARPPVAAPPPQFHVAAAHLREAPHEPVRLAQGERLCERERGRVGCHLQRGPVSDFLAQHGGAAPVA